ncbi:hypothetical protein GCM10010252_27010 [Streptomyces aureoverticillatus]|nr:hypothetical protein GCM10010252_27010 [Streptomyces aureoverticillatus]
MLAGLAVVQADDQAQTGIEAEGGQGGVDVRLVVVMDERERGRLTHSGLGQRRLVEVRRLQDAGEPTSPRGRARRSLAR